ncbi:MAG: response regulator transcription factor [Cytophagales bacterium]|nr:response regulator transcription factor [Cytophagales bacterium]
MNFTRKVFIVEDDKELRNSFTHIVSNSNQFVVTGSYRSAEEAIKDLPRKRPEIILMDIVLPEMNGVEATQFIKEHFPSIEIVIVTVYEDNELVFNALKAGASGYITKSANYLELLAALEEIIKGGAPMSTRIARMVIGNFHLNPNSPLTKREKEIIRMIADGKTYSQISDELFISKETAKTHIRNIYSKLQVNKKSDAIAKAQEQRLI